MLTVVACALLAVVIVVLVGLRAPGSRVQLGDVSCKAAIKDAAAVKLPPHDIGARKVLVTHGCTFVGKAVVKALLNLPAPPQVIVFDQRKTFDDTKVKFLQQSLLRKEEIAAAVQGIDVVFHCPDVFTYPSRDVCKAMTVQGTANLVEACDAASVRRLVFVSDVRAGFAGLPASAAAEDDCKKPSLFPLFRFLAAAEDKVRQAAVTRTVILRASGTFGPREPHIFPPLAKAAQTGRIPTASPASRVVDFTYVGNVVHAAFLAATKLGASASCAGQTFHVTNDEPVPFWTFAATILTALKYDTLHVSLLRFVAFRKLLGALLAPLGMAKGLLDPVRLQYEATNQYFSCAKAKRDLAYRPVWSVQQGIVLTVRGLQKLRNPDAEEDDVLDDSKLPEYTVEEVAKHATDDDAWLIIDGKVYDLSDYVLRHPGGDAILNNVGGDASTGFHGPQHPKTVHDTVKTYLIGKIVPTANN